MPRVHFLNVNDGDCSIIQHGSGRNTVIDVSAAKKPAALSLAAGRISLREAISANAREKSKAAGVRGNFNQSENPDNPIEYMRARGIDSVFRFICTHPDMDHLDGIKHLFEVFNPGNFWDTDNTKTLDAFGNGYNADDWEFYTSLRDGNHEPGIKRLALYSGASGEFYNSDGLNVLAPTVELVRAANEAEDWNDCSYVLLYRSFGKRILFCGDSHDDTWDHILTHWRAAVSNVDVLIAPHHGRHSSREFDFLNVVQPKLTLFGNAPSEYLSYDEWNNRDLLFVTNNQAGSIVLDLVDSNLDVYASHKPFAVAFTSSRGYETKYNSDINGWFLGRLT